MASDHLGRDATERSQPAPISAQAFAVLPFDFLVVGGGTAGLTLASRIASHRADPPILVGLLEAGPTTPPVTASRAEENGVNLPDAVAIPGLYGAPLWDPRVDWCFETEPQPGLGRGLQGNAKVGEETEYRRLRWNRGRLLGGTSALNFMTWNRPAREDLDGWARALGNEGWGWDDML